MAVWATLIPYGDNLFFMADATITEEPIPASQAMTTSEMSVSGAAALAGAALTTFRS